MLCNQKRLRCPQPPRRGAIAGALACLLFFLVVTEPGLAQVPPPGYSLDVSVRLKKARDLLSSGKFEEARNLVDEVRKTLPDCVDAYEIIGISYLRQGDCRQAETALQRANQLDPNNSNILNNLGNALYRQNKLDASIEAYKKALSLTSDESYKLLVNLANSYADKGQIDDARQAFSDAIKAKADFAPAYLGLGRMYFEHGQNDLAEEAIRHAIQYKSDYANAYFYLGQIDMRTGNNVDAITAFNTSLRYETNPRYISDTQRLLEQAKQASRSGFSRADSAPPSQASAQPQASAIKPANPAEKEKMVAAANQMLKNHDWQGAQKQLEQIIQIFGTDDPIVWNNLGYARVHQGTKNSTRAYEEAIADYKKAIRVKGSGFPSAQYNLGQAYRLLDDRKYAREAEKAFRQAIEDARLDHTTCPLAQNALGVMLKQRGDFKGADLAFRRAILQSGLELPVAHYNLAILLEQHEDNTRGAADEYEVYLRLAPSGLNAQSARARLKRLGKDVPTAPPGRS